MITTILRSLRNPSQAACPQAGARSAMPTTNHQRYGSRRHLPASIALGCCMGGTILERGEETLIGQTRRGTKLAPLNSIARIAALQRQGCKKALVASAGR